MPAGTRDACGVKRNPISWPSTVGGEQVFAREVTRAILAAAIAGVLGGTARTVRAQQTSLLPRPPGARVVTLPREPGDRHHETSVAVNPLDPRQVIVSFQQPLSGAAAGRWAPYVAWSGDGGERWTVAQGIAPPNYVLAADP